MYSRKVRNILVSRYQQDEHQYQFLRKHKGKQFNLILTLTNMEHTDRVTRYVMLKSARAELRNHRLTVGH